MGPAQDSTDAEAAKRFAPREVGAVDPSILKQPQGVCRGIVKHVHTRHGRVDVEPPVVAKVQRLPVLAATAATASIALLPRRS